MQFRSFCLAPALLVEALGTPATADTIMGAGSLQSWDTSVLGPAGSPTSGGPYWNSVSADSQHWLVLDWESDLPDWRSSRAIPFFENGTSAVSNMFFANSIGSIQVSLLGNFTSQTGGPDGINYFGWYAIQPDGTLGMMSDYGVPRRR